MSESAILIERDPPLAWLIFNRPEKLNAFNLAMWRALPERLAELEADPEVRVIIVRGAGDRAFAAGADISEFADVRKDPETAAKYSATNERAFRALRECHKPTIAMIHGFCVGGGCALALNIDLRIAAEDARFALTPAKLGLGYPYGGIEHAVRELGAPAARYLFMTADQVDAARAKELGVVQEVAPAAELRARTLELARRIAENSPMTLRAIKLSIRESLKDPAERDIAAIRAAIAACFASEDYREGLRAFAEKRKPNFSGR